MMLTGQRVIKRAHSGEIRSAVRDVEGGISDYKLHNEFGLKLIRKIGKKGETNGKNTRI